MIYICITNIDYTTGIPCTEAPMRTGPTVPSIKGFVFDWNNISKWPIATTQQGVYLEAPLMFGSCDDDADLSVSGIISTYPAEEYQTLRVAEHQARKPFPSWVGDFETMRWEAPVPYPLDNKEYYWDESIINWVEVTRVNIFP